MQKCNLCAEARPEDERRSKRMLLQCQLWCAHATFAVRCEPRLERPGNRQTRRLSNRSEAARQGSVSESDGLKARDFVAQADTDAADRDKHEAWREIEDYRR